MKGRKQPVLYFENTAGAIWEDPDGFLRVYWSAHPREMEDTRGLFTHIMRGLTRYGWSRVLIRQTGMPAFTIAEQQWVAQQWLPMAVVEGGYRHGAVVVSEDVMVRLATAYVTTQVQGLPLVYRSFGTEEAAATWLRQQPATP